MTKSQCVGWGTIFAAVCLVGTSFSDTAAAMTTNACDRQQGFYLRRDKLDISIYNQSIDASAAEGAAISYTGDREKIRKPRKSTPSRHGSSPEIPAHRSASLRSVGPISPVMPLPLPFSATAR